MKRLIALLLLSGCATAESIARRCAADPAPYSSVAACNQTLLAEAKQSEAVMGDAIGKGMIQASQIPYQPYTPTPSVTCTTLGTTTRCY